MAAERKTSRSALAIAVGLGGVTHTLLWSFVFAQLGVQGPYFLAGGAVSWVLLAWWPLRGSLAPPGPLRAALVMGPVASASISTGPIALMLGLSWSLGIVLWWRNALETTDLSARRLARLFLASSLGGPMWGVLSSPRLVDAVGLMESTEAHDVSRFQRLLVTRTPTATRLWLDGKRQLSSDDERRYHEALVRPAMSHAPTRVLILGGGDGMAAREVLSHPCVTALTLVELDAAVPRIVRNSSLSGLSNEAFRDSRLELVIEDALKWLDREQRTFQTIIVDFPDPSTPSLASLFALETWQQVRQHLEPGGRCGIQSSSLLFPSVVSSIAASVKEAGLVARVYSRVVPSFGSNAFILASHEAIDDAALRLNAPAQTLIDDADLRELCTPAMAPARFADPVSSRNQNSLRRLSAGLTSPERDCSSAGARARPGPALPAPQARTRRTGRAAPS